MPRLNRKLGDPNRTPASQNSNQNRSPAVASLPEEIDRRLRDMADVLYRRGEHATHRPRQLGRCVYCSCGVRAQGKMQVDVPAADLVGWEVRMSDGFVAYVGDDRSRVDGILERDPDATVTRLDAPRFGP